MKTIKFISALALTLGLAACDSYDLPNPPGQNYPEPDGYFENSGLVLTPNTEAVSLAAFNEANQFVTVATIDELSNFPEGYDLVIDMQLGNNKEFSKSTILTTTIEENVLTINPDVLNGAIQEVITKEPGTYSVPVRFLAYAVRGTTRMGLGGIGATYGEGTMKIQTYDAAKVIENAYYIVPCDVKGNPQLSKAIKMNNTAGGNVSPYDNPEFAVKLDVPEETPYLFMIAPQSAITAANGEGLYGANAGDLDMNGKLVVGLNAIKMPIAGSVLVTVNMEQDSYVINYAFEVIYPLYGSTKAENCMALYTDDYINYYGVTAINNRWRIYTQADKKGVIFKMDPAVEPTVAENGLSAEGAITSAADGIDLTAPVKGNCLYYVDVNLVQKTYSLKALQTMTVIGGGNGWNLETATPLTASKDLKVWTAKDVELGDEFKINCNGAWDYDFGGVKVEDTTGKYVYNLNFKGSNMQTKPGKYDIEINFSTMPYVLTLTPKN